MVEILAGNLKRNEVNPNAMGGTELIATEMHRRLPQDLLKDFQIIHSRPRDLYDDLKKVLVLHDLAGDPEVEHLKNGGWNNYDKLVFVSNWQLQMYNAYLGVPYSKSVVIKNAINPIYKEEDMISLPRFEGGFGDFHPEKIKIIYHTTPHRGLNILYAVFEVLAKEFDFIELDVYSSFKLYGWEERDKQHKDVFDKLNAHPMINNHGSVSNDEVRNALKDAHIFAYPSVWQETSCICLMEALAAGLLCVHPNLGALPETSANWSVMYQFDEDQQKHANTFYNYLRNYIMKIHEFGMPNMVNQVHYANNFYNWDDRENEWLRLLSSMKLEK